MGTRLDKERSEIIEILTIIIVVAIGIFISAIIYYTINSNEEQGRKNARTYESVQSEILNKRLK